MIFSNIYSCRTTPWIILVIILAVITQTYGWHGFSNAAYHCWDLTASSTNPAPINCEGFSIRWIDTPGNTIKLNEVFTMTYELIIEDGFYTWAYDEGFFNGIGTIANSTDAKSWCESVNCPTASSADKTNCCVWHVNVHSCLIDDTDGNLCGPWIPPSGATHTHSVTLVGPVDTGNWTSEITGLYRVGITSMIAHFKIAGMQIALETKLSVVPRAECGDSLCEENEGEDCETCPKDCGKCPLTTWQLALIGTAGFLIVVGIIGTFLYFRYQKSKLLWDESWIIPTEEIKQDDGLRGAFGSMLGSNMDLSTAASDGVSSNNMSQAAAKRQIFILTASYRGRTYAMKEVKKKEFSLTKQVRYEVREVRECDHINLCKFVGASIVAPNIQILSEYCPKGSLSDVLLNDDVPLNWAFRFSFAADISRGMQCLHSHKIYHGRLKSNNCVVDDRWTVKITDYGLRILRSNDVISSDDDVMEDDDDDFYQEKRANIYKAPESLSASGCHGTPAEDVYAFSIILIEIATRNDPYGDEDSFNVPPGWKPPLPDLSPEMCENKDDICPCPNDLLKLISHCWSDSPDERPTFDEIKKTIHKINPSKMSPVDMMMAMMEKYSKHLESIVAERTQDLVAEKSKTDRLLYSMLPKSVADDLRVGKPVEAKYHDNCTIYFSDIVGFTTISGGSTAMQVVGLLNKLYITFDEIIDKYNVYKVETIGDAYMVVSGIPEHTPFHAREVADMAIDLVRACEVFTIPHMPGEPLKIRVGLHSGSACAGVVGLKMPRYCLFGDTVNTASRMESNGEAYKIHISNFTYEELAKIGKYNIQKRGTIPVKGKGEMVTWWLTGHDPTYVEERKSLVSDVNDNRSCLISESGNNKINSTTNIKDLNELNAEHGNTLSQEEINNIRNKSNDTDLINVKPNTGAEYKHDKSVKEMTTKVTELIDIPADIDMLFTPVEVTDKSSKQRKISRLSNMTSDSGFTDKSDEGNTDGQDVIVRSCTSLRECLEDTEQDSSIEHTNV